MIKKKKQQKNPPRIPNQFQTDHVIPITGVLHFTDSGALLLFMTLASIDAVSRSGFFT